MYANLGSHSIYTNKRRRKRKIHA